MPQPQTIVTDRRLLPTHRGIVVDLRAVGLHVLVIELVHGATLYQIYGALPTDVRARVQALFAGRLGHRFFVNGKLMNVALPLPPDTDVICVFPPAGPGEAVDDVDMASAIWDDNPSSSHLSAAAGPHVAPSFAITSTTSTTSTTTAMPTDGAFLSSDDDGLVPASERRQRKGEMQRRAADRAQRARSAGMSNAPYTLFDEAAGARILQRLPHWSRRQCVFHAMAAARVIDAAGRLLEHPVPGWPEPQVIVSNGRLWRSHRAVVHLVNGEETAPSVSQVPQGASIARLHGLLGRFAPTNCWVHDFQYDCMDPVPDDTDYIRVHEADSDVFLARLPGLDTPEAVPRHHFLQPAYPSHFRARGYIPHHGFPRATRDVHYVVPRPPTPPVPRDGSASSSSASLDDGSSSCSGHVVEHSMTFTVFDVHHHVRVASVALPATRQDLLQAVLEATPQLRPPLGHRVLREPLAGFPLPQIVVWQEPLAAEKVIPVMHSEVPQAVCTVSMPTSGTTYQLSYVIEQACDTPPPCRWAVAKEQAHFTLDGASFPPFIGCNFGAVDSAVYASGPPSHFRLSAARWARPHPDSIMVVSHDTLTDAPVGEAVMVHRVARDPVICYVPHHLGFGRMCTVIGRQLAEHVPYFILPQYCPLVAELPLHLVASERPRAIGHGLAILDLRRIAVPGVAGFRVVQLPAAVDLAWVRTQATAFGLPGSTISAAFFDDQQLVRAVEPFWQVHIITCMGPIFRLPGSGPLRLPALLDASTLLHSRIGVWHAYFRFRESTVPRLPWRSGQQAGTHYIEPDAFVDYDVPTVYHDDHMPGDDAFELIVHLLHDSSLRVWVPRTASWEQVREHVGFLVGIPDGQLFWPSLAPRLPAHPCHVVLLPPVMSAHGLAIVDARRVHPGHNTGMWLVHLPDRVLRSGAFSELLGSRQVCLTPSTIMVDGRQIGRDLAAAPHVQCVTILARAFDGQDCLFDNQAALARHIGFLLHTQVARASTVTTTSPAFPILPFSTTTTTSEVLRVEAALPIPWNSLDTTCIHLHLASLRGSYLTGTMHTGDTLEATLASLCQVWQREGQLEPDVVIQCHPRAYFTRRGVHLFLHTWRAGIVPRCWVFAPRWAFDPFLAQTEVGIDAQELVTALGAGAHPPPVVSVNGKPQRARFRPFHGDVVIVSSLGGEIQSLPLSNLLHRLPDVQVLLLRLRLPTTAGVEDDAGPFSGHWRAEFAGGQALFGLHRPGGRCTIAGVSFPCLILGTGELVDPSLEEMQQYWDRLLAPLFGACTLCDTGASDGSRPVFVQRWSLPGRLPWISRLPTGIDVVVADPGGAGLDAPTPGYDWRLRPVLRSTWFGLASYTAFCTGPLAPFQSLEGVLPAVLETSPQQSAQTAAVGSRLPWAHDAASAEHTTPPVSVHASSGASGSASQRLSQPSSQQASTSLSGTIASVTNAGGFGGSVAVVAAEGTLLSEPPREAAVNISAGQDDTLAHPHQSLLQVSLYLTKAAASTPSPPVKTTVGSSMCLKVWTLSGQAPPIAFAPDARAGEVSELVARALGPSHGAHSLYPVFPAVDGEFHCVSVAGLEPADFLVFVTGPAETFHRACTISASDQGKELLCKLGCSTGVLFHGDRRWAGPCQGAFHGMHLRLRLETGSHPLRAVATPCRNGSAGFGNSKSRHTVSLQQAVPPPRDGVAFGLDADMVVDMLSAHRPSALRLSVPPAVDLHPVALSAWDALPSWQPARPVDALYIFTDGSFHPHTRLSTWAVVCLAAQDGHIHKLGCLSDFCSTRDIEGLGAFAGEVEALLHAHAIAAAADCRQAHIGSDCTSALMACSGQCGSPLQLAEAVDATLGLAYLAEGKGTHYSP